MKRISYALLFMTTLAPFACASPTADGPAESSAETQSALHATGTLWSSRTIPVCFETGADARFGTGYAGRVSSVPNFATYKQWMREAIEDTWGRYTMLRFVNWGDCPSNDDSAMSGWVAVTWGNLNNTTIGWKSNTWTRMGLIQPTDTSDATKTAFQGTVRHEMGHALGFQHELDRTDAHGTDSPADCRYGINANGTIYTPNDPASIMNFTYCGEAHGQLSPWDIIGAQKAYGRKWAGEIVGLGGRCVNVPDSQVDQPLIAYDCYGGPNDTWSRLSGGATAFRTNLRSNTYLAPDSPVNPWGTTVRASTSREGAWSLQSVQWRAFGEMCVAVAAAETGQDLILRKCDPNDASELWNFDNTPHIQLAGTNLCVNAWGGSDASGTALKLYPCGNYDNEAFTFATSVIKYHDACFNVLGGSPDEGARVALWACHLPPSADVNDLFHLRGRVVSPASGQCLDMAGGVSSNGVPIDIYPCVSGAPNQEWDIYF
jgi:hypothetical protein